MYDSNNNSNSIYDGSHGGHGGMNHLSPKRGTSYNKNGRNRKFYYQSRIWNDYNVVVADFKKYLLQFNRLIKNAKCLVIGADGLPNTLRNFSKIQWIPMVMHVQFLVMELS